MMKASGIFVLGRISTGWSRFFCVLGVFIIGTILARVFFSECGYHSLPWYSRADMDAILGPQILVLANDGDYTFLHHPDATPLAEQILIHRVLAAFDPEHRLVFRLFDLTSFDEVVRLLDTVVRTGRVVALSNALALAAAMFVLIALVTKNWFIAFAFSGAAATSSAIVNPLNLAAMRAETQSVALFLGAVSLVYWLLSKRRMPFAGLLLGFVGVGFGLGLAFWAKVQILPQVALLLLAVTAVILTGLSPLTEGNNKRMAKVNIGLALASMLFLPTCALHRPSFLTPEFVSRITYQPDIALYGGRSPDNFAGPARLVLGGLFLAALGAFLVRDRFAGNWTVRLLWLSFIFNLLVLGAIVSTYAVVLPLSVSWEGYVANLNHLVYVTVKNVTQGSFSVSLFRQTEQWRLTNALLNIWRARDGMVPGANLLLWVAAAGTICAVRTTMRGNKREIAYLLPAVSLVAGLTADLFSTTRNTSHVMSYYGVYSVPFYLIGLGLFAHLELKHLDSPVRYRGVWRAVVGSALVAGAGLTFAYHSYLLSTGAQGCPTTGDSPERGWQLAGFVPQFGVALETVLRDDPNWTRGTATGQPVPPCLNLMLAGGEDAVNRGSSRYSTVASLSTETAQNLSWEIADDNPKMPVVSELETITVGLWVNIHDWGSGGETVLFGDRNMHFAISIVPEGLGKFRPRLYDGPDSWVDSSGSITRDEWHHILIAKDGRSARLYVDGQETGNGFSDTRLVFPNQLGLFDVGRIADGAPKTLEIGDVCLWDAAFTQGQVRTLFDHQFMMFLQPADRNYRELLERESLSRR